MTEPEAIDDEPKILFVDQTAALGGAEFSLLDVIAPYQRDSHVVLFEDGPFRRLLEEHEVSVEVVRTTLSVFRRESRTMAAMSLLPNLARAMGAVARRSRHFDVIYANTQKAMLVAAMAGRLTRTPVVFHLHDILSEAHFSMANRWLSTRFANHFCRAVMADSQATAQAFIDSGGHEELVSVVHYGFEAPTIERARSELFEELDIDPNQFVVGHFSRLSPWKGQEVLVEALRHCPADTHVLLVGDAIFGENDFVRALRHTIATAGLAERVTFAGFRSDVSDLMAACDVVVHSSTAPEPFGRVIVEAMLSGTPVIAADAGGPRQILRHGETGWLTPPGDATALARCITSRLKDQLGAGVVATAALDDALERFNMEQMHAAIAPVLRDVVQRSTEP